MIAGNAVRISIVKSMKNRNLKRNSSIQVNFCNA